MKNTGINWAYGLRLRAACCLAMAFLSLCAFVVAGPRADGKKKKSEPFQVRRLTQGMGLDSIGPVSPDGKFALLIAHKPEAAPNLYMMALSDYSIRPPLTQFRWGIADPQWSSDGEMIALAGYNETASFSEIYVIDFKDGKSYRLTTNNFSDRQPVFTFDGKRVLYATDESPLPDAAFGILHIASAVIGKGKPEYFTEDETSSAQPGLSPDGKSVLLVKINEQSGRHSLWQYGLDGKPQRDLTGSKFARIHRYVPNRAANLVVLWAQEQPEQQEAVYTLDLKTGEAAPLPDPDLPKRSPAISPDGKLIAFIGATDDEGAQLFLFDSTTGDIKQLTALGTNTFTPAFIANDLILFGSDRDKASEVYLVNLSAPAGEDKKKK